MAVLVADVGDPATERLAQATLDAVEGALGSTSASDESGGMAAPPQLVAPLPVYSLSEHGSTFQPRQTGWRYLVVHSDNIGAVDVAIDHDGQPSLVADPDVAARIARAAGRAQEEADPEHDYELRLLDLSRFSSSVLWLAALGGEDRFYSLSADPERLDVTDTLDEYAVAARRSAAGRSDDPEAGG